MVFGTGDTVRVTQVVRKREGWLETWESPNMDRMVQGVYTVTAADESHGIQLDNSFWFPPAALEMVYQ